MPRYFERLNGVGLMLLIAALLFSQTTSENNWKSYFAIWNVGQGQWTTLIEPNRCLHFDMGGDRPVVTHLISQCFKRENYLYITHPDLDHVNFVRKFYRKLKHLCLASKRPDDDQNQQHWAFLPICEPQGLRENVWELTPTKKFSDANSNSHIWLLSVGSTLILIPGDSTAKAEKLWINDLDQWAKSNLFATSLTENNSIHKPKYKSMILVVGHHGSKTSSTEILLTYIHNKFPFTTAVVSARKKRYGHPHKDIVERFRKFEIPLLKTESLQNIVFEIP